ncbi:MAG: hypothetical protein ACRDPK_18890, partial [Carbonactinosporaceae bacterium]
MLVSAAVCPNPPLLVPELAGRAAPELDGLRAACDAALSRVAGTGPDRLVVLGSAVSERRFDEGTRGTLRPYGFDVPVVLGEGGRSAGAGGPATGPTGLPEALPLSLTVGAWLLH